MPRRQCVLGAVRFVPAHPLGIVSAEQFDQLELVIYKRGFNSLRFSYMMKGTGLTEFGIGTPRPQLNVSATLHHSAFDLASWDRMLLPFYAPI